jgi:hypothetical protein
MEVMWKKGNDYWLHSRGMDEHLKQPVKLTDYSAPTSVKQTDLQSRHHMKTQGVDEE